MQIIYINLYMFLMQMSHLASSKLRKNSEKYVKRILINVMHVECTY